MRAQPNIRSAAGLNSRIRRSWSAVMIASFAASRIAPCRASLSMLAR